MKLRAIQRLLTRRPLSAGGVKDGAAADDPSREAEIRSGWNRQEYSALNKTGAGQESDPPEEKFRRPEVDGYHLGLRVAGELAGGSGTGETFPARRPAAIDDGAAVLGRHAGQETELADTTLL